MSRFPIRVLATLLVCGAVASCTTTPSASYVRYEVIGLPQDGAIVPLGEPVTVEIRWFDESGAPVEPGWFQWLGSANPIMGAGQEGSGVTFEEGIGMRKAHVIPSRVGRYAFEAFSRPCPTCDDDRFGPVEVWVAGPATELHVFNPNPSSMVVGEVRPFAALPAGIKFGSLDNRPIRTPDSVVVSVDDPNVASVDKNGVVTATGLGETTVRFAAGSATAEIVLQVQEGAVGPPSVGIHPILGERGIHNEKGLASFGEKTDHHLVVDDRNWPTLVASAPLNIEFSPALVISWTGSGFGVEPVGQFLQQPAQASLALDKQGQLYLCYVSNDPGLPGIYLAQRPGNGHPGDWTYRDLPRRPVLSVGQEVVPWNDLSPERDWPSGPIAMMPAVDEGIFVAYRTVGLNPTGTYFLDAYAETWRMVHVTDQELVADDIETITVSREWRLSGPLAAWDAYVIPPEAEGAYPRLVVLRALPPNAYTHALLFQKVDGIWGQPTRILPDPDPKYDNLQIYGPTDIAPVLPMPDYGDPEWLHSLAMPAEDLYGLATYNSMWQGMTNVSPLMRRTPYGDVTYDDPAALLMEPDLPQQDSFLGIRTWPMMGVAVTPGRLHWVGERTQANMVYVTVDPVRPAYVSDSEVQGRRLTVGPRVPAPRGPITVLPSGARMVTLANYLTPPDWKTYDPKGVDLVSTVLLRSQGPDHPWNVLASDGLTFGHYSYWFETQGQTLGLNQNPGAVAEVVRLGPNDVLEKVLTLPVNGDIVGAQMVGNAMFVLVASDFGDNSLFYSSDPVAGVAFVDLLKDQPWAPIKVQPRSVALLLDGQEVLLFSRVIATASGGLVLNVFDAGGNLVSTTKATQPALKGNDVVSSASVMSDGTLYYWSEGSNGIPFLMRSKDRLKTIEVAASWPDSWLPPPPLVQLPDGRLAMAVTYRTSADIWKSFVMLSEDGTTWGTPIPIRPDGGNGQRTASLAVQGEDLLVLLLDNGAMRAYGLFAATDIQEYAMMLTPWMDALAVTVGVTDKP